MLTSILRRISRRKTGLSRWLRDGAALYLDYYNDFSYAFEENGEHHVLASLSAFSMRTVFDVGANVGNWSLAAATLLPEARIFAFELSESTRSLLKRNLSDKRFVVPDLALGAMDGTVTYKDYGEASTLSTLVDTSFHDDRGSTYVERSATLATGDTFMARHGLDVIDLLKIDVEGAEHLVLEGFRNAISSRAIRVIQFEYGFANGDAGHLMKSFYDILGEAGYEIGRIWTAGVRFGRFDYAMNNFDSGPNYLAVLRSETGIVDALRSSV